jgi:hypothetical protein
MNQEQTEIARLLTGLEGFEWTAGMRSMWDGCGACGGTSWRILSVADDGWPLRAIIEDGTHQLNAWGMVGQPGAAALHIPDLTDAATGGILLEALGAGWQAHRHEDGSWSVYHWDRLVGSGSYGRTIAEACARAQIARRHY